MSKKEETGFECLDLRGKSYDESISLLLNQYENAYTVWSRYPQVDPKLKETFRILTLILKDYKRMRNVK